MNLHQTIAFILIFMVLFPQTNFQAILATDERITFVIFLYDEDDILDMILQSGIIFIAGFDAGDGRRGLSLPLDLQEGVYRIDGSSFL